MNREIRERFFDARNAFDHPVTLGLTVGVVVVLAAAPVVIAILARSGRVGPALRDELKRRWRSWLVLVPLLVIPVLLGAGWVIMGVGMLSMFCYREFARATGLFREKVVSLTVVLGIAAQIFAVLDNWYRLFVALTPLTVAALAAAALLADRPHGYIQRVALGVLGFLLFGTCLAHLGYLANDRNYRAYIVLTVLAVQANDVFAFICGKLFGRRKLAPHTSPNKTVAGAVGAILLTTVLVVGVGSFLFASSELTAYGISPLKELRYLILLGLIVSATGQLGDLMMSSIKRDLQLKDMGQLIPGHGGLLDRFDSLLLAAPAVFHFGNYVAGVATDVPTCILTGS